MDNGRMAIGLKCGRIADIVFPHNNDRTQRDRLAIALVELTWLLRDAPLPSPEKQP